MIDAMDTVNEFLGDAEKAQCPTHPEAMISRDGATNVCFNSATDKITCRICGKDLERCEEAPE